MAHSLAVDVGGTFTDFVTVNAEREVRLFKVLTTPADPSAGVLDGAARFAAARDGAGDAPERVIHGTTLVANSLIERRGARTALLTTRGFTDVLEIAREARYDNYDLDLVRPEPLIGRPLRLPVAERVLADGTVLEPLHEEEAVALARSLRALGVESVAIALINSYANPVHERKLAEAIGREAPAIDVTLSADIAPEWREYERTSTAAANAFVRPLVRRYLGRLEAGFARMGAPGRLYVMLSHGGVTSAEVAGDHAIELVESGPAGGVIAAAYFGARLGLRDLISFDMGGTTAKVSLIEGGVPLKVPHFEVARVARFKRGSGLPLRISTIELIEIGTGGGSIAHADALGLLKVGPESAGADPGPACYGTGGEQPTVTDADLHLGLLDAAYFLGGTMPLRPDCSEEALARLAGTLGICTSACAQGIFEVVNRQMSLAMRTHVVERGHDPQRFTLVAFGGAGPVHAYELARHLRIPRIVYPPAAGVASALGFLVSPFAIDLVRTLPAQLGQMSWTAVAERYDEMSRQAQALLSRAGADLSRVVFERSVDMRYAGQGYEVPVTVAEGRLGPELEPALRASFTQAYERRFGSHLDSAPAEGLHWRLRAMVPAPGAELAFGKPLPGDPRKPSRRVWFPELGEAIETPVYDRYRLAPGTRLQAPLLIEERESTIVVGPSGSAEVDDLGNVLVSIPGGEQVR
jgi:N-methylhydantoinase A